MATNDQRVPRQASRAVRQGVRRLNLELQNYLDSAARRVGHHRSDMVAIGALLEASRAGQAMTPGALSRAMNLSAAAVSALLDRLARAGHVVRAPHGGDRRRVVVEPTQRAADVSAEVFASINIAHEETLAGYSDEELALVERVLADLTEATRRARTQDGDVAASPRSSSPPPDGSDRSV